jgi:hypothetical protein
MVADMTRWAEHARREPLWAATTPTCPGKSPRRPRRPAKVSQDVVGRFLMAVRAGNSRDTAARFAGISNATLYRWLRDPRPPFSALRQALLIAEAEVECEVVTTLYNRSFGDTEAAVFLLERRFPDRWLPGGPKRAGEAAMFMPRCAEDRGIESRFVRGKPRNLVAMYYSPMPPVRL